MREFDEFKEEVLRRKQRRKEKSRRKRHFIVCVCLMLCLSITAGVFLWPTTKVQALDLMKGIRAQNVAGKEPDAAFRQAQLSFALELFRQCREVDGENVLVSPLSVMLALAMTANGAQGETLAQMEDVLGLPIGELNAYLKTYVKKLPSNWRTKLHIANSIWFREGLDVNRDFLQTNANYYGADAYATPFDAQTLKDINTWVDENTKGMIDHILDEITPNSIMYLVNALCFDAKWARGLFDSSKTVPGYFGTDGNNQTVTKMESTANQYLHAGIAEGFMKEYRGGKYKFVALMPNRNVPLENFVDWLTVQNLCSILDSAKTAKVMTLIPEFTADYEMELSGVLRQMGMSDAFDRYAADFSSLLDTPVDGNIYIGRVLHKTHITVNAEGTKAAASTVVEVKSDSIGSSGPAYDYIVDLSRPFLYMIVDSETNLPLFIGTLDQVN